MCSTQWTQNDAGTAILRELTDQEIRWSLEGSPWPTSSPVLDVAHDALVLIEDEIALAVIIRLTDTIVNLRVQLASIQEVLSAAMTFAAAQHGQARQARQRLAERLQAERKAR